MRSFVNVKAPDANVLVGANFGQGFLLVSLSRNFTPAILVGSTKKVCKRVKEGIINRFACLSVLRFSKIVNFGCCS